MKIYLLILLLTELCWCAFAQSNEVRVQQNEDGMKLVVDGKDFFVKGMNWDYYPIGTNYTYNLWSQPENTIKSALDQEMTLLKNMGVNTIRTYTGIPKEWIEYIFKNYGIYTMLNHAFGRYGLTIEGKWMANTEYDDPRVKELLIQETTQLVQDYKDTPGLLLFLLGNENNYGLFWEDPESENISEERNESILRTRAMYKLFLLRDNKNNLSRKEAKNDDVALKDKISTVRAKAMYKLFNEAALAMKGIDGSHPVAICNGDLMFIEIVNEVCKDIDIFGTNMYRGISFGDTFQRVKQALNKPIMFTEFGADAYNVLKKEEDQESQAYYLVGSWKEIYSNVAGIGGTGNCIGGFTFHFSDGWWKVDQTKNLDVHDNNASWSNGGYYKDHEEGKNNMNEEWFGICAKGKTDSKGLYTLFPRAAYFALKEIHKFSLYKTTSTLTALENHFSNIHLKKAIEDSENYCNTLKRNDK